MAITSSNRFDLCCISSNDNDSVGSIAILKKVYKLGVVYLFTFFYLTSILWAAEIQIPLNIYNDGYEEVTDLLGIVTYKNEQALEKENKQEEAITVEKFQIQLPPKSKMAEPIIHHIRSGIIKDIEFWLIFKDDKTMLLAKLIVKPATIESFKLIVRDGILKPTTFYVLPPGFNVWDVCLKCEKDRMK